MPRSKDSIATRPARAAECDICREVFGSRASLNSHRWRHFCTVCRAVFVNTNDTTVHMRQSHKDDGVFADKCSVCFEVFPSNAALWQHFIDRHHRSNRSIEESELPPFLADMIAESSPTDDAVKSAATAALMGPLLSAASAAAAAAAAAANGKDNGAAALAAFFKPDSGNTAFPIFPFPTALPATGAAGIGSGDPDNKTRSPASKSPGISTHLANAIKSQVSSTLPLGLPATDGKNLRSSPKASAIPDLNSLQSHCFVVTPTGIPIGVLPMSASLLAGAAAGLGGLPFPAAFQQQLQQHLANTASSPAAVKQEPLDKDTNDNQLLLDTADGDRQAKKTRLDSGHSSSQTQAPMSRISDEEDAMNGGGRQPALGNSLNHHKNNTRPPSNSSTTSMSSPTNHANNDGESSAGKEAASQSLGEHPVKREQEPAKHVRMRKRTPACKMINGVPLASSLMTSHSEQAKNHHQSSSASAHLSTSVNRSNSSSSSSSNADAGLTTSLHQIINRLTNKASTSKDHSDVAMETDNNNGVMSPLGTISDDEEEEDGCCRGEEQQALVYALATFDSATLWSELKRRKFVFACQCGQSFTEKMPYMMHRGGHVTRDGLRRCPDCAFEMRAWTDYVMHILSHQQ